tara:strand:- start:2971 stop:3234 length:264 start_codon:yes stop_codon:yes gene_type:complete
MEYIVTMSENYIKSLPADVLDTLTERALDKAFRHVQDEIGVQSGDFAQAWADPNQVSAFKEWMKSYAIAERKFYVDYLENRAKEISQ